LCANEKKKLYTDDVHQPVKLSHFAKPRKFSAAVELDKKIQKHLRRYDRELEYDESAAVRRAYKELTTTLSGRVRANSVRLRILAEWAKEPALKIGFAAFKWLEGHYARRGYDEKYFMGIVRKSATSWLIEYRNERDRREFKLRAR
jgi:hypothetical protein